MWIYDILIVLKSHEIVKKLTENLIRKFKMEYRGKIRQILGLRVTQTELGISIDRETFIEKALKRFGMEDCEPSKTPAEVKFKLKKANEQEHKIDETAYRSMVGSLLYLSKQTRPDITWITNQLPRHMQNPTSQHCTALKRVLRSAVHRSNEDYVQRRLWSKSSMCIWCCLDWRRFR